MHILLRGIRRGLTITWELGVKVVLPAYILVSLLNYTPVIKWISNLLEPLMHIIGLPGEAALPLVLGALVSFYAGVGALVPLGFDAKELTIIAAFILCAHDLPLESVISKKSGSRVSSLIMVRLLAAAGLAMFINQII
ncbi:nucleoside recognition domain-containing protein [Syntrophomonas curvata]